MGSPRTEAHKVRALAYARRIRARITAELGGKCAECGDCDSLEFHHTAPRRWQAAAVSRWMRAKLYLDDHHRGELELLCADCNKSAGTPTDPTLAHVPF